MPPTPTSAISTNFLLSAFPAAQTAFHESTDNLKEKRSETPGKTGRPERESFDYSDVISG